MDQQQPQPIAPVPTQAVAQPQTQSVYDIQVLASTDKTAAINTVFAEMSSNIIKQQQLIIGPMLALEQARHVEGLTVDPNTYVCTITGNGREVIDKLIEQYREFFGHAAVEVCREATSQFMSRLPEGEKPNLLK
jgi:hypothetical protein